MKKFFLALGVACLSLSSFAATRTLYSQDFENVSTPADAGWSFGGDKISIASDDYGKFLELSQGQVNGRSGIVTWGPEIFLDDQGLSLLEDGTYTLSYEFSIAVGSNNQYNSAITVFTNHKPIDNQPFRTPWATPIHGWDNYLFDMSQVDGQSVQYYIMGDAVKNQDADGNRTADTITGDVTTFETGAWYGVELNVNVNTRQVEWSVVNTVTGSPVKSGTYTVPAEDEEGNAISMYAEGLFVMCARYQTTYQFDNIKVYFESAHDYANKPSIALTRVGRTADDELNLNLRAYTIVFAEGETLHVTGTNGTTEEIDWADCDGAYVYETTESGTLTAYTTSGDATSETVSVDVDCAPIALPAVEAVITSVEAGFGKTYTLNVSNADVPLRPTIFISYEFTGANGETITATDEASGCKVTVSEQGTLKITSAAFGYQATEVSVKNNIEFETKKVYDFARMTQDEIVAAGFTGGWQVLNSATTSGFQNWTARGRLYYNLAGSETVDDSGETVYTRVLPFGYISDDNTTNVMNYTELDANETGEGLFDGLTVFAGQNVSFIHHVGVYNNATAGGNYKNIIVKDLDPTDFVVANRIADYGSNSNHPVVATDDEYYALLEGDNEVFSVAEVGEEVLDEAEAGTGKFNVTVPVYRIDTACTKLTVFAQAGVVEDGAGVTEIVKSEVTGDNWYYTIDGIRVAEPTRPGIYIHNGKKIIVRK